MKRATFATILSFEVRSDEFPIAGSARPLKILSHKRSIHINRRRAPTGEMLFDPCPVLIVVCDDAHLTPGSEHSHTLPEELILHDTTSMMTALRPRIGKIDVDHLKDAGRTPPSDELRRVCVEHPNIRQSRSSNAIGRVREKLAFDLNPEKVDVFRGSGLLKQKRPLAGADFEFERPRRLGKP